MHRNVTITGGSIISFNVSDMPSSLYVWSLFSQKLFEVHVLSSCAFLAHNVQNYLVTIPN